MVLADTDSGSFEHSLISVFKGTGFYQLLCTGKDILVIITTILFQHIHDKIGQRNITHRGFRLRCSHLDGSFAFCPIKMNPLNGLADMKHLAVEVNVCPFQGAGFTDTHTRVHGQNHSAARIGVFFLSGGDDLLLLLLRKNNGFLDFLLWKLCVLDKVCIIMCVLRPFCSPFHHDDHIAYVLCRQPLGELFRDKIADAADIELAVFQFSEIWDNVLFQLVAVNRIAALLD